MGNLYEKIKKDLLIEMKLIDATMKGISESEEYKDARAYNAGIRAAMKVLDNHEEFQEMMGKCEAKKVCTAGQGHDVYCYCPACGSFLGHESDWHHDQTKYCSNCGQKLKEYQTTSQ